MSTRRFTITLHLLAAVALVALATGPAAADDRDLFSLSSANPYVFIIFDTSGSMNWGPGNDAFVPGNMDDPNSKFYQAKDALFEVLTDPELQDINWGFAQYNQDGVAVYTKHWLYTPSTTPPWVTAGLNYLDAGDIKLFGDPCMDDHDYDQDPLQPFPDYCDLDADDNDVNGYTFGGCANGDTQELTSAEDVGELLYFPILGHDGTATSYEWVEPKAASDPLQNREFRLRYDMAAGSSMGDNSINVVVRVEEQAGCGSWLGDTLGGPWTVTFDRAYPADTEGLALNGASETIVWQIDSHTQKGSSIRAGFFDPDDIHAHNYCPGWEDNDDSSADLYDGGELIKWPTVTDPLTRGTAFNRGDLIPLDWTNAWETCGTCGVFGGLSPREAILQRLAPNWDPVTNPPPEFRVAPYFEDTRTPETNDTTPDYTFLRLKNSGKPPLMASGSTPLGASLYDFDRWYQNWVPVASGANGDPEFDCKTVNVLVLTDGDDTCNSGDGTVRDPCNAAGNLFQNRNVRTYVVGFGLTSSTTLNCMADNGGTGVDLNGDGDPEGPGPIFPQNKQELVDALKRIVIAVRASARTFASAAVPSVQASGLDNVYLTSFNPIGNSSNWFGRIDAYVKPVPFVEVTRGTETLIIANRNKDCASQGPDNCLAWDAGEELLSQAPTVTDILTPDYKLGTARDQRRVYVSLAGAEVPRIRRYLVPPSDPAEQIDIYSTMGLNPIDPNFLIDGQVVIENTLVIKTAPIEDPITGLVNNTDYLLGDIFHSDPVVIDQPNRPLYHASDLYEMVDEFGVDRFGTNTPPPACAVVGEPVSGVEPNRGYRCFFEAHEWRRKMLFAGSNDGQLHAVDAGLPSLLDGADGITRVVYGEGTGNELFAFSPRGVLPKLKDYSDNLGHDYSVDGPVTYDDVFIDPVHDRSVEAPIDIAAPQSAHREWRSVIMAGLREGGRIYYALDITQPDDIVMTTVDSGEPTERVIPIGNPGDQYVPSCSDTDPECSLLEPQGLQMPWPMVLWERGDTWDEDNNGSPDMGFTWSAVRSGRIRVTESGVARDVFVAIFGGGMDPAYKREPVDPDTGVANPYSGNYLYMVDIETGDIIYKRRLDIRYDNPLTVDYGSMTPSAVAAVDTKLNGYLDTIYIGTTGGVMFKVDISDPQPLVTTTTDDYSTGSPPPTTRTVTRVIDTTWDPFPVFDTGGRPIYFSPAVMFVGQVGRYAVAFGTGDREDIVDSQTGLEGRFYVLLDTGWAAADTSLPYDETDYTIIDANVATDANLGKSVNLLTNPTNGKKAGWVLDLDLEERVIARAFALAGVTVFSTFTPDPPGTGINAGLCSRGGFSNIFVVATTNADSILTIDANDSRYMRVDDFVTQPYTELSAEKSGGSGGGGGGGGPVEVPCPTETYAYLASLMPTECKFANTTIRVKTVTSGTSNICIAEVPICIVEKNWKEF